MLAYHIWKHKNSPDAGVVEYCKPVLSSTPTQALDHPGCEYVFVKSGGYSPTLDLLTLDLCTVILFARFICTEEHESTSTIKAGKSEVLAMPLRRCMDTYDFLYAFETCLYYYQMTSSTCSVHLQTLKML